MKSGYSISRLELRDAKPNGLHIAGDIITRIGRWKLGIKDYHECISGRKGQGRSQLPGIFQSLGLVPETITLMRSWFFPGFGIGLSTMVVVMPLLSSLDTWTSFILMIAER